MLANNYDYVSKETNLTNKYFIQFLKEVFASCLKNSANFSHEFGGIKPENEWYDVA